MTTRLILGDWPITTPTEAPKAGWGVRVVGDTIAAIGPHADLHDQYPDHEIHEAGGYVIAPGFVDTDRVSPFLYGPQGDEIRNQSPLGRVAKPEEVARTALFLASEGSEFLTGCIVDVNGASYLRS